MQERVFRKFFDVAEIAALSKEEYAKYWESEKIFYDNVGAFMAAGPKASQKARQRARLKVGQKARMRSIVRMPRR